jgi:hypothetical protein
MPSALCPGFRERALLFHASGAFYTAVKGGMMSASIAITPSIQKRTKNGQPTHIKPNHLHTNGEV